MASATNLKKKVLANGKVKYQAQVWHEGRFYCSKTFDMENVARDYKEERLRAIVRGTLKPAAERAAQRRAEEALDQPMTHWASLYVEEVAHGKSRLAEYDLVGRLRADKTLRDFNGKAGAQLIKKLLIDWRHDRRPRSKKEPQLGAPAPKPLGEQTLRLRLFALLRIIRLANDKLPSDVPFDVPDTGGLFEFKPPPAHAAPRDRQPADAEFARLLTQAGVDSELGEFMRTIDETGCRLSEVRNANGADVQFFTAAGQVVGGFLTLRHHKPSARSACATCRCPCRGPACSTRAS